MKALDLELLENFICNSKKLVILAVGNPIRGDDSVGLRVGEKLERLGFTVLFAELSPENYFFKILENEYTHVIIIDAVKAPYTPGTILMLDKEDMLTYPATTHDIPITLFLELLEKERISYLIIGIVPKILDFTEEISEEIKSAVTSLVDNFKKIKCIEK